MSIPKDIQSYLTIDEEIVIIKNVAEGEVFVTNKRIIFKQKGLQRASLDEEIRGIIEVSYQDISSIDHKHARVSWGWLTLGVVLIIFALGIKAPDIVFIIGMMGGIFCIVMSFYTIPRYTLHIFRRKPITLSARNLEETIKVINRYRDNDNVD